VDDTPQSRYRGVAQTVPPDVVVLCGVAATDDAFDLFHAGKARVAGQALSDAAVHVVGGRSAQAPIGKYAAAIAAALWAGQLRTIPV